jgi:hypothetical protein
MYAPSIPFWSLPEVLILAQGTSSTLLPLTKCLLGRRGSETETGEGPNQPHRARAPVQGGAQGQVHRLVRGAVPRLQRLAAQRRARLLEDRVRAGRADIPVQQRLQVRGGQQRRQVILRRRDCESSKSRCQVPYCQLPQDPLHILTGCMEAALSHRHLVSGQSCVQH